MKFTFLFGLFLLRCKLTTNPLSFDTCLRSDENTSRFALVQATNKAPRFLMTVAVFVLQFYLVFYPWCIRRSLKNESNQPVCNHTSFLQLYCIRFAVAAHSNMAHWPSILANSHGGVCADSAIKSPYFWRSKTHELANLNCFSMTRFVPQRHRYRREFTSFYQQKMKGEYLQ